MLLSIHPDGFAKLIAKSMRQRPGREDGFLQSCIRRPRCNGMQHRLPYVRWLPVDQRDGQMLSTGPFPGKPRCDLQPGDTATDYHQSVLFGHSGPSFKSSVHPCQPTGPLEGCGTAVPPGGSCGT